MSFITPGIKYIKVSKFDSEGRNNTTSLREITDLRLNTNDNGFINYPIVARTEYEDYFLLQTVTTNITSSTNNQILDYQVNVQNTIAFTFDPSTGAEFDLIEYDIENSNPLGYMDVGSGEYTLGNTPNIPIIITASADWNNNFFGVPQSTRPIVSLRRIISPFQNQIILSSTAPSPSLTGTVTLTGSFTPIENEVYGIFVSDLINIDPTRFVGNTLIVTQSQSPVAGIGSQVIIEPYLPVPFINSDYNAIINNAVTSRPNENFFDVDFSSNQITAVNEVSIISASRGIGFATPSTVPQSNYTTRRITSPRYIGKELTSAEFNEYTGPTTNFTSSLGLQTNFYPGDIAYGKTSNVGNPAVNFVFFEYLAGSSPEWGGPGKEGKTIVNVKYIIDENGNVTQPVNDVNGINLGTIQQTFNGKDNAIVLLDDNDAFGVDFSGLNGPQSIFKSGYRIDPIIYTQSGSSFVDEISFLNPAGGNAIICDDFWAPTPTLPSNVLTVSVATDEVTGLNNFVGFQQVDIPNSGFNPISNTFNPQPSDEIRFEETEELTFLIINVGSTIINNDDNIPTSTLTLTLDKPIPSGTLLDKFLLRRYTPDPSSILLNVTKGSGGTSTGILKPEFLSPEVESKLETILSDLKNKNII
jgi:hypothetical protein